MSHHCFATALSVATLIAALPGCGGSNPPPKSRSSAQPVPSRHASNARNAESSGEEALQEPVHTGSDHHLAASGKVFDIMMAELDPNAIRKLAALLPNSSPEEQQAFAEQMLGIFRSDEFRRDYCAILMETLSAEECERLSELLSDPVLRKFQKNKVEYMTRMISLAEKHLERQRSAK